MSDKMMRRTLIVCAGVLVLCGLPMVVMAVVQRDVRMGLYGVMSLLFALSDVLQLFLVGGCWAAPSGHDVRFEDAAGRWVYEGQLRADTVRHGVIPDRSNHQERHEILRVESFDGDVKAVQSFLNEHDAAISPRSLLSSPSSLRHWATRHASTSPRSSNASCATFSDCWRRNE